MKKQIGFLAILLLAGFDGVVAQRPGARRPPGGRGQRAQMEQRIQSRFDLMVRDQLELSDEQGQQLGDIVEGFLQRRQELTLRERQVRGTVLSLGTGSAEEGEFSDEEATDALQEMVRLREEETSLFREEQEALVGVLTPQQLVRFVVMRSQLAERIQRIRSGERPRGGPSGRPRGGRLPEGVVPER